MCLLNEPSIQMFSLIFPNSILLGYADQQGISLMSNTKIDNIYTMEEGEQTTNPIRGVIQLTSTTPKGQFPQSCTIQQK